MGAPLGHTHKAYRLLSHPALAPVKRRQLLPKPTIPPLHTGGFAHAHFTRTSGGMSVSIVNTKRYTPSMNVAIAGEGRPL